MLRMPQLDTCCAAAWITVWLISINQSLGKSCKFNTACSASSASSVRREIAPATSGKSREGETSVARELTDTEASIFASVRDVHLAGPVAKL